MLLSVLRRSWAGLGLLAVGLAASLSGCGDTFVDPFLREGGPFSVYGVLISESQTATQRVRIQAVRTLPDPPTDPRQPAAAFSALVWTKNLTTGDSLLWNRSEVRLPDGTLGVLFEQRFYPRPGSIYRLHIQRAADDRLTTADLLVPAIPQATLALPVVSGGRVTQAVTWSAARLAETRFNVRVGTPEGLRPVFVDVGLPQPGEPLVLDFTAIAAEVRRQIDFSPAEPIGLAEAGLIVLGADETWPLPPGDLREMAQPGVYTNVENGYGFVGAVTRGAVVWQPDADAMRAAGFEPRY